jgi:hypothetical protein
VTIGDVLALLGLVVVVGIIVKGFWGSTRVKPIEQPDNWQDYPSRREGNNAARTEGSEETG